MSQRLAYIALRYLWTAWLSLLRWLSLIALLVFMALTMLKGDSTYIGELVVFGLLFLGSLLWFVFESPNVCCLQCGGRLLRPTKCSKHPEAKTILKSTVLYCTLALASFARSVLCPFCGQRFRMNGGSQRKRRRVSQTPPAASDPTMY